MVISMTEQTIPSLAEVIAVRDYGRKGNDAGRKVGKALRSQADLRMATADALRVLLVEVTGMLCEAAVRTNNLEARLEALEAQAPRPRVKVPAVCVKVSA
jgi:hypothetical protein